MLSEIGSARASIAASYLALWRKAGDASIDDEAQPSARLDEALPARGGSRAGTVGLVRD